MYFLRLTKLKPAVEQTATEAWCDFQVRLSLSTANILSHSQRRLPEKRHVASNACWTFVRASCVGSSAPFSWR